MVLTSVQACTERRHCTHRCTHEGGRGWWLICSRGSVQGCIDLPGTADAGLCTWRQITASQNLKTNVKYSNTNRHSAHMCFIPTIQQKKIEKFEYANPYVCSYGRSWTNLTYIKMLSDYFLFSNIRTKQIDGNRSGEHISVKKRVY